MKRNQKLDTIKAENNNHASKKDMWVPSKDFPGAILERIQKDYNSIQISQLFEQNVHQEFSRIKEDGFFYLRIPARFTLDSKLLSTTSETSTEYIDVFAYCLKERIMTPFTVRYVNGSAKRATLHDQMKGVTLYAGPMTTPPGLPIRVGGKVIEDLVRKILSIHGLLYSNEMFNGKSFVIASGKAATITIMTNDTPGENWTLHFPNPVIPVSCTSIREDELWNSKFFTTKEFVPSLLKRFLDIESDETGHVDFSNRKVIRTLLKHNLGFSVHETGKGHYERGLDA